jgi:hypothetical protein
MLPDLHSPFDASLLKFRRSLLSVLGGGPVEGKGQGEGGRGSSVVWLHPASTVVCYELPPCLPGWVGIAR